MRIKLTNTWKTKVAVAIPGPGVDETIEGKFVVEFRALPISEIKGIDKERRDLQRQLDRARDGDMADDELADLEDRVANADTGLIDRILVAVHELELEDADGHALSSAETLKYVKDHTDFTVPIIQAFTGRMAQAAEKNSGKSGSR